MTPTSILLLITSAITHAGWNLIGKREHPTGAFFLAASSFGFLLLFPTIFLFGGALKLFPPQVWWLLILTGVCQALYYSALAGAYRQGDLSIAYPLARSLPVLLVTIITTILGRGSQLSGPYILGTVLILAGCFMIPMKRFSDFSLRNYCTPAFLLAVAAAVGTAGYSIIDDEALRYARTAAAPGYSILQVTLLYACLEGFVSSIWLGAYITITPQGRGELRALRQNYPLNAALMGIGIQVAYSLVLTAMAFSRNVSYVVAFRQLSILIGAALGVILLKEPAHLTKLIGVLIAFTGLIMVGIG